MASSVGVPQREQNFSRTIIRTPPARHCMHSPYSSSGADMRCPHPVQWGP